MPDSSQPISATAMPVTMSQITCWRVNSVLSQTKSENTPEKTT